MVTCRQESEERHGDGGKARGHEDGAGRAFQLVDRRAERVRRRRAARAVGVFLRPAFHGRRIGKEHGGGVNDGRIDETVVVRRVVSGMGKAGVHAGAGEDFVSVFHGPVRKDGGNFEATTFRQSAREVNPQGFNRRRIQSASNVEQANLLGDLLRSFVIFCPNRGQLPINSGVWPENGGAPLTLRHFEHEISNLAPGGWRVPQVRPSGKRVLRIKQDNRKRL